MFEQKFRSLETFRECLANGLLDDPRSRKTNECVWLRYDYVAEKRETRRYATHGRVGKHRNEWQARAGQLRQSRSSLRHLHQRHKAFLHARSTARGEADKRQILFA